ncbi:MAG: hypothetical protein EDM05_027535 [Leptolyngbya sp. IPPAS B-1204]|uniref:Uncharacterized protein n=1 Tax=Leptolyngbya sp. NK1-12 TaxID=2547451 RepID=A0AA97AJK5_9CYAN|nr:hypothetical protein [Leptolyngbya sp. NK1-12]MBF2050993.1 hypothetical protein [Elainella sp. C42_A2020_010]RNJ66838.1 MAG: hypothetical protein EDM05_23520 [Leptolyngbya sp. IPPAS B-1204]WNZ22787.1 hypothetical protein HJG54_07915 [Leptolyngbya sp. NK1-12]
MKKRPEPHQQLGMRLFLMGGALAVIAGLTMDVRESISFERANRRPENCAGTVNADATISREQLASFLTIPERGTKTAVLDILQMPYCQLPNLEIRAGVPAERSVYRLAFDPQTWLVVLFEGEEYAGYQFRVMR